MIECVAAFRASPAATLRRRIVLGGAAACALVVLVSLLAHQPRVAAGFLGLGLMTALAYFVVNGVSRRTDLFTKTRGLVMESRGDWLIGLAGVALFATTLVVLHLHWAYIGFAILGVVLALAIHFEVDRKVESERHEAVSEARAMLKALRLQGVAEETLRQFVRTTAGDDWEEFFTALFGSEAARAARTPSDRGLRGLIRKRSLPWRDWVTSWVEARQETRRQAREKLFLQAIEERGLVAEGVNLLTARRKSRRIAEAMVAVSAEIRAAARAPASPPPAGFAGQSVGRPGHPPGGRGARERPRRAGARTPWAGDLPGLGTAARAPDPLSVRDRVARGLPPLGRPERDRHRRPDQGRGHPGDRAPRPAPGTPRHPDRRPRPVRKRRPCASRFSPGPCRTCSTISTPARPA